ncbi:MAG: PIN domain-containing protein [Nanoarchaeota archaeon]
MDLVVDANVVFALLIKDGITAELFADDRLVLFAPEHLVDELRKHHVTISSKTHRTPDQLDISLQLALSRMQLLPHAFMTPYMEGATRITTDPNDAAYLALALRLEIPLWSNDVALKAQPHVPVFTTSEIYRIIRERNHKL